MIECAPFAVGTQASLRRAMWQHDFEHYRLVEAGGSESLVLAGKIDTTAAGTPRFESET